MDTWAFHLDDVRRSDSLTKDEKKDILDGLTKLSQIFDDDWLQRIRQERHPLLGYLLNKAPWSQLYLADFGRKLATLKGLAKFEELRERLRDSKRYIGAEAEVEIAAKLMVGGINDIELYPKVQVGGRTKEPDIRAVVDGEVVYFEVSSLGESEDAVKAQETQLELVPPLFDPEIICFCQIHKILSKPRREEFRAKIQEAFVEVKRTKGHCYIGEPGVLDYLAIHRNKQEDCNVLVEHFRMKMEISGPPFERDDAKRLNLKVKKESRQLPEDSPGVIVVLGSLLYFGSIESFYEDLIYQIEETIYDQDKLIAGVIISKTGDFGQTSEVHKKPHYILHRKSRNLVDESVTVIRNRYSKFIINEKIINVFVS